MDHQAARWPRVGQHRSSTASPRPRPEPGALPSTSPPLSHTHTNTVALHSPTGSRRSASPEALRNKAGLDSPAPSSTVQSPIPRERCPLCRRQNLRRGRPLGADRSLQAPGLPLPLLPQALRGSGPTFVPAAHRRRREEAEECRLSAAVIAEQAMPKTARELAKKSSDAHSPAPKIHRSGGTEQVALAAVVTSKVEVVQPALASADVAQWRKCWRLLRGEMTDVKNETKNDLLEVRGSFDEAFERADGIQDVVDKAFAPLAETVERHETSLVNRDERIKHLDDRISAHAAALEQMCLEILELRGAQSTSEATVHEVRLELAMPSGAPPPVLPRVSGGWDRAVEPYILQANASALFSAEVLVAALAPVAEAATVSLDDIEIRTPTGVTLAKRGTLEVEGREVRDAARRASMVMGALRDGA